MSLDRFPTDPAVLFPPLRSEWHYLRHLEWAPRTVPSSPDWLGSLHERVQQLADVQVVEANRRDGTACVNRDEVASLPEAYYLARLDASFSPLAVFVEAAHRESGSRLSRLSSAIEDHFWNALRGYQVLPEIAQGMVRIGSEVLLTECDLTQQRLQAARTPGAAYQEHALARIQMVALMAGGHLSLEAAWTGAFLADYLLVQRAFAADIRAAGRASGPCTAVSLEQRYDANRLASSRARRYVLRPQSMMRAFAGARLSQARFLDVEVRWRDIIEAAAAYQPDVGSVRFGPDRC